MSEISETVMTDTFGRIMRDAHEGKDSNYIIERDDGFIRHTSGDQYVLTFVEWNESEKKAMKDIKSKSTEYK